MEPEASPTKVREEGKEPLWPLLLFFTLVCGCALVWIWWLERTRAPVADGIIDPGARVFVAYRCQSCHHLSSLSSTSLEDSPAKLGPSLDGLALRASERVVGMDAQQYVRESIREPGSYVVTGYVNAMPSFARNMSEKDLKSLVDWLLSETGGS